MYKITQQFTALMPDMEVRKTEKVKRTYDGKEYERLQVDFDDKDCNRVVLLDKNLENVDIYKKGVVGTVYVKVTEKTVPRKAPNGGYFIGDAVEYEIENFVCE